MVEETINLFPSMLQLGTFGLAMAGAYGLKFLKIKPSVEDIIKDVCMANNIYVKKDKKTLTPTLLEKKRYVWGWQIVLINPIGLNPMKYDKNKGAFDSSLQGNCFFTPEKNKVHLRVVTKQIPRKLLYNDPLNKVFKGYSEEMTVESAVCELLKNNFVFALPVGFTYNKIVFLDFYEPLTAHALLGGYTGSGKSSWVRQAIYFMSKVYPKNYFELWFTDLKEGGKEVKSLRGIDNLVYPATTLGSAIELLESLESEYISRANKFSRVREAETLHELYSLGLVDKYFKERPPFILLVIDEFRTIYEGDKDQKAKVLGIIKKLLTKARFTGIHVIVGTQRPDHEVVGGEIKGNLSCSISFRTKDGINSEIILGRGNTQAKDIKLKGRGIFQDIDEYLFQTPYIHQKQLPKPDYDKDEPIMKDKDIEVEEDNSFLSDDIEWED